jgi:phage terminase large subunit-like protein
MTQYVKNARFRKFAPIDREYPIFELVEGDDVLLDVSASEDGVLEVALHEAGRGKIFKLDDLYALLIQGKRLLEGEMACGS